MFSDEIMNESMYDVEFILLLAETLLTLLTCTLPTVHIMSNLLEICLTVVALHCNTNGWLICGSLAAVISTVVIGST